jgi:hypothetical protein
MNRGVFEKFAAFDFGRECFMGEKKVITTIQLARAG